MISMIGMHYDPRYFPNPKKFDPERFNEVNKKNRRGYVYFPFGEGPHVCIGKNDTGAITLTLSVNSFLVSTSFSFQELELDFCKPNWA